MSAQDKYLINLIYYTTQFEKKKKKRVEEVSNAETRSHHLRRCHFCLLFFCNVSIMVVVVVIFKLNSFCSIRHHFVHIKTILIEETLVHKIST